MKPGPQSLAQSFRRVAHRLKLQCGCYDPASDQFGSPEEQLWWQVVEEAMVDLAHRDHVKAIKRQHYEDAVDFFHDERLEILALLLEFHPGYFRRIVNKAREEILP